MMNMKMQKSSLTVDGNNVHLSMPIAKVDKENRLVSGFATLDNIDTQGDVVTAEASAKAFARARGNLREMHSPIAVGKVVNFREDEFYDQETEKFYRGVFVTAYVSKGAPDTWEKVVDGTLTGFSIGGEVIDSSSEFVKEAGRTIKFINDYELVELSLVDNPANQLANVFSIQKSASGSVTVKGMAMDTKVESVFICATDDTVVVKDSESEDCPVCEHKMENAGWFEVGPDRTEKVREILTKFRNESEATLNFESEGGVEMAKNGDAVEDPKTPEEVVEEVETDDNTSEEESEETVEEVEETEEEGEETPDDVTDEETEISKKIDELHTAVKDSLEKSAEDTAAKIAAVEKKIEDATQSFLSKASELEEKMGEFGTKIEATKSRLLDIENSLEKMNSASALKKSAEVEQPRSVKTNNTSWNGAFSGKSHFSVDDVV